MSHDQHIQESGSHLVAWSEARARLNENLETASRLATSLEDAAKRLRSAVEWAGRDDRSDTIPEAFPYPTAEQVNGLIAEIKRHAGMATKSRDQLRMKHPHLEL